MHFMRQELMRIHQHCKNIERLRGEIQEEFDDMQRKSDEIEKNSKTEI